MFFTPKYYIGEKESMGENGKFLGKDYFHYLQIKEWDCLFVIICSDDGNEILRVTELLNKNGLNAGQYTDYRVVMEREQEIKKLPIQIKDDYRENFTDRGKAYWKLAASFFSKDRKLRILEIGVYKAGLIKRLNLWMDEQSISEYVGVDPYWGIEGDSYFGTYYTGHTEASNVYEYAKEIYARTAYGRLCRQSSDEFFESLKQSGEEEGFDIIIVDGDHSYYGCMKDMEHAKRFLKTDGLLLCDDYANVDAKEVTRAVNDFLRKEIHMTKEIKYAVQTFQNPGKFIPISLTIVGIRFKE